jgi:hypothetical protein
MESVVLSWIFGMITGKLHGITKEHGVAACQIWHTIEHQFIGNSETRALHLDTTLRNFVRGDHLMSDYCCKMMSMANSLGDLGRAVFDCNLILSVLRGLN